MNILICPCDLKLIQNLFKNSSNITHVLRLAFALKLTYILQHCVAFVFVTGTKFVVLLFSITNFSGVCFFVCFTYCYDQPCQSLHIMHELNTYEENHTFKVSLTLFVCFSSFPSPRGQVAHLLNRSKSVILPTQCQSTPAVQILTHVTQIDKCLENVRKSPDGVIFHKRGLRQSR